MDRIPANVERTKPYIMVIGDPDDASRKYLTDLGTGVSFVKHENIYSQNHFDIVISFASRYDIPHLYGDAPVLHFSGMNETDEYEKVAEYGRYEYEEYGNQNIGYRYSIYRTPGSKAVDFDVLGGLTEPPTVHRIASETIYANMFRGFQHSVVNVNVDPDLDDSKVQVVPLVAERGGPANAAVLEFTECAPFWTLPPETTNHVRWVKLFLEVMKRRSPDDFPLDEVELSDEYRTPAELVARTAVVDHDAETFRLVEHRKQEVRALEQLAVQAERDADAGDRKLLTTQGKELEHWVAKTLEAFGFDVEDMDKHTGKHQTNKREDFRSTIPGEPGDVGDGERWVCLVEVKGRSGGARVTDLRQINSAADIFTGKYDNAPTARRYVVNAEMDKAAQAREKPLKSSPEDVADFAKEGGLVLDTRELFRLKRALDAGDATPEQIRGALMEQTGWFDFPDLA